MAKKLLTVFALLLATANTACSDRLQAVLYNNTRVDLTVYAEPGTVLAHVAPGESAEVYLQESQWIDFGMIAYRYEHRGWRVKDFVQKNTIKVQAESDGRLYIVPFDAAFPVKTFPEQAAGFPLVPVEKVDLT